MFSRRHFLLGTLAAPLAAKNKKRPVEHPNVLLLLADDLGAWMLGCYGNKEIRTPNIDRLAELGIRFTNFLACAPADSPNRATLLSGRIPSQHGIADTLAGPPPASFANEVLIPDILAGAGYNCGYAGKWHLGNDQQAQHHFAYWKTMPPDAGPDQNPAVAAAAAQFLDQQAAGKPFFLTAAFLNTMAPYPGSLGRYEDLYAATTFDSVGRLSAAANAAADKDILQNPVPSLRKSAAGITAMDEQVQAILGRLQQKGLAENTLIIFTSVRGYLLGRHGLWSDGYASNPINLFDEVVKTPMIVKWPGKTPPQTERPDLIASYDLLPTVCEATGTDVPKTGALPGRSFLAAVTNQPLPKKEPWRQIIFGQFRNAELARDRRYKLILRDQGHTPGQLFDLAADPRETVNHYDDESFVTVRDGMAAQIAAWRSHKAPWGK